ncbi:hypothetical protein JCM11251_008001 [Rhodosporidiobolus azoricus]
MSSCSFASYLSMRCNAVAAAASAGSPSSSHNGSMGGGAMTAGSFHPSPPMAPHSALPHHFLSPLDLSDAGSPNKRQRNTSPDHRDSAPSSASILRPDAVSYFGFASSSSSPPSSHILAPTPCASSLASTPCAPRSILCTPSSPSRFVHFLCSPPFPELTGSSSNRSTSPSSPYTSPPCSRPLSRRSSTSKSVRFARCTNASVFPTHSTEEYDRSPIVPTGESESLELKRTDDDDDDGGWVQCHVRDKKRAQQDKDAAHQAAIQAAAVAAGAKLPKHSPAMENPVEGVHGLIEGGFFVGDSAERDGCHPALQPPRSPSLEPTPMATIPPPTTGVHCVATAVIPEVEDDEQLEFEDEGMVVDDSTESASDESHGSANVPALVRTGSMSDDDDSSANGSSSAHSADDFALRSSSPDGTGLDSEAAMRAACEAGMADQEPRIRRGSATSSDGGYGASEDGGSSDTVGEKERKKAECRKRFGLCAFGKVSRSELFASHDSLGGF